MNPEIKAQWVAALRSREYQQGRGNLRHGDKFCCLGVLCDIAVKAGVASETVEDRNGEEFFAYDGHGGNTPLSVQVWSGVDEWGRIPGGESLTALNDSRRLNFDQIADVIEKRF